MDQETRKAIAKALLKAASTLEGRVNVEPFVSATAMNGQSYSDSHGEWSVQDIIALAEQKRLQSFDTRELAEIAFMPSSEEEFDEVPGSPDFVRRAERSDLSYPIVVVQYNDGKFIADGNHRLWKALHIEGRDKIDGFLLTEEELHSLPQLHKSSTSRSRP